jgi:hypothetical protein
MKGEKGQNGMAACMHPDLGLKRNLTGVSPGLDQEPERRYGESATMASPPEIAFGSTGSEAAAIAGP